MGSRLDRYRRGTSSRLCESSPASREVEGRWLERMSRGREGCEVLYEARRWLYLSVARNRGNC